MIVPVGGPIPCLCVVPQPQRSQASALLTFLQIVSLGLGIVATVRSLR